VFDLHDARRKNGEVEGQLFHLRPLLKARPKTTTVAGVGLYSYEVFDNGQRFLINTPAATDATPRLTLLVGWPALAPQ
jgi:hypothetical protein